MSSVTGAQNPYSSNSDLNAQIFIVKQILNRAHTATLVKVVSVTTSGGLNAPGFVNVQPLVNLVDGEGNAVPHAVAYSLPYFRLQGGSNAIILDPSIGDIGIAIFADHDISAVISTKAQANPGSKRRFSMSDGLYIGGVLNGVPSQFVQFNASGITITSPNQVTVNAPITNMTGELRVSGEITAKYGSGSSVTLTGHNHAQPADSHGDTESPTNAPTAGT